MHHNLAPLERAINQAQMEAALFAGGALASLAAMVLHNALADIMVRAEDLPQTDNEQNPVRIYIGLCRRVDELLWHTGSNGAGGGDGSVTN